jgi:hypothetical protein
LSDGSAPFVTRIGVGALIALAIALAVRYLLVETPALAWACQVESGAPWWCPLRQAAVAVLRSGAPGFLSVAAGLLAILGGGRMVAGVAVIAGAAGLVLYAAGPAALGLVLGAIRAVRL